MELQRQNQLVERDVQRYRERQKYLQTIEHLKLKKLWVVGALFVLGRLVNDWSTTTCRHFKTYVTCRRCKSLHSKGPTLEIRTINV